MPVWAVHHRLPWTTHHQDRAIPLPSKVDAIVNFPRSLTIKSLQEFFSITTASSLRLPNSCTPFRKLWKTKPQDTLWTGPRREIWPLGRRRTLWLNQQCWRTQHPMLPSPSPQMLQAMQWAQYTSSGWTVPGNHSLSSASNYAQTNRNTTLFFFNYLFIRKFHISWQLQVDLQLLASKLYRTKGFVAIISC